MKILILQHDFGDYECELTNDACLVVPDDFCQYSLKKLQADWRAETWAPRPYRKTVTKRNYPTIPFHQWLSGRFEPVEFLEDCTE